MLPLTRFEKILRSEILSWSNCTAQWWLLYLSWFWFITYHILYRYENFLFWPRHCQHPQTRNSCSRSVLSFLCSVCGSNCPELIIRGFPFKGNNSWIHLYCYNMFGARKACRIDNLLALTFRTQMVSPIQNSLTKNLETTCRVILTKNQSEDDSESTDDGFDHFANHQVHLSTSRQWLCLSCMTSVWFFFLLLTEIISMNCKMFDHCTLFCPKTRETNT